MISGVIHNPRGYGRGKGVLIITSYNYISLIWSNEPHRWDLRSVKGPKNCPRGLWMTPFFEVVSNSIVSENCINWAIQKRPWSYLWVSDFKYQSHINYLQFGEGQAPYFPTQKIFGSFFPLKREYAISFHGFQFETNFVCTCKDLFVIISSSQKKVLVWGIHNFFFDM